jgi:hypothetical protein
MSIATQYDVTVLTLSPLLIEPEFKHLFSNNQLVKRAENVFKSIRAFLSETQMCLDHSLKTIQFVVPPTAQSLFDNIRQLLLTTTTATTKAQN